MKCDKFDSTESGFTRLNRLLLWSRDQLTSHATVMTSKHDISLALGSAVDVSPAPRQCRHWPVCAEFKLTRDSLFAVYLRRLLRMSKVRKLDRAADGINRLRLQVTQADAMYEVQLELKSWEAGDVLTVAHLATEVAKVSRIPVNKQILSFKGNKLLDNSKPLSLLGMTNCSIVQLRLNEAVETASSFQCQMQRMECIIDQTEHVLSDLIYKCDGIHRGYNPQDYNMHTLLDYESIMERCQATFQLLMDQLLDMDLTAADSSLKNYRRQLVRRLQTYLHRCDGVGCALRDVIARLAVHN